jgi:DNA-binding response OmpR family regulator
MPGTLDGNGLVQRIRMERPSLTLVMVSGRCPEPAIASLLDGYLAKPVEPSQVGACVRALASAHDQTQPILSPCVPVSQEQAVATGAVPAAE